jgi:hypothetical protein
VLEGTLIGRNVQRHRHQEFIRFLNAIEAEIPPGEVVRVILDKLCHPQTPELLAMARPSPALLLRLHAAAGKSGRFTRHAPSPREIYRG